MKSQFQEAMQIRDSLNEVEEMAQSRINIARMLVESKKFDEAARLAREAIGLVEELPLGDRLPNAYLALGQCQLRQGKIEDAITSGERCLALNRQISSKRGEVFAMNLLVQSYKSAGRFDEATRFANEALELNREMGDERGLQRISWQLADIKSKASSF